MLYIHSFGVVPLKQEKKEWKVLLVLHQEANHWGFPKGKSDGNETPLESAKRELLEETGLHIVTLLQETPFLEQYQFRRKQLTISKTVSYFPALVAGDLHLQVEEIREGRWCSIEEALALLSFQEARTVLLATMKRVKENAS